MAPTNRIEAVIQAAWEVLLHISNLYDSPCWAAAEIAAWCPKAAVLLVVCSRQSTFVGSGPSGSTATSNRHTLVLTQDTLSLEPGSIGVHANFFEVGGNSLRAGVVVSKVREMLKAPEIPGKRPTCYKDETLQLCTCRCTVLGLVLVLVQPQGKLSSICAGMQAPGSTSRRRLHPWHPSWR